MTFVTIPFAASVVRDESELAAKPHYVNADKIRAVGGKMETLYGQELACSSRLTGTCRGAYAWADLARTAWAAFGTHLRLQVIDQDGVLYDTTPVIARAELANPFAVSSGSATITVTDDGHGVSADQLVHFPAAASAANVLVSGSYVVSAVLSASAYTFSASTATQSTAAVGGTVDVEYGLAPGNVSNLGGLGYGTGGYGSGGYGAPASTQDLDARTWNFANWGQNLIANPNWGGIYEWAPHISSSELVGAGDFSSTGAWSLGSGWSVGAGTSSASSGARLSQAVTLSRSSWHLLRFDVTHNSGSVQPLIGSASVGSAITTSGGQHSQSPERLRRRAVVAGYRAVPAARYRAQTRP